MATTGRSPPIAMPAAPVTACCSAMPTSKKRSGKRSWNGMRPVGPGMAAVMATRSGRCSASLSTASANACVYPVGTHVGGPVARIEDRRVVEVLLVVVLGRRVAPALLGEDVHEDGALELGGVAQRVLERLDVVAVDGAGVADAERLEERRRLEVLADGGLDGVHPAARLPTDERHLAHEVLHPPLASHVHGVEADLLQALRQPRHGGRVGAAVVVEDDDDVAVGVTEVVQRLVGHAPGHRAVADDGDDVAPLGVDAAVAGHGQAVGVGEDRRRVAVLHEVVLGLRPARVARQPAGLAELLEAGPAPGDDLVDVRLVAGVPQHGVGGGVEHPVQREGELDGTEVGAEVPAGLGDGLHDEVAELAGELVELLVAEGPQIGRLVDGVEEHQDADVSPGRGAAGRRAGVRRLPSDGALW